MEVVILVARNRQDPSKESCAFLVSLPSRRYVEKGWRPALISEIFQHCESLIDTQKKKVSRHQAGEPHPLGQSYISGAILPQNSVALAVQPCSAQTSRRQDSKHFCQLIFPHEKLIGMASAKAPRNGSCNRRNFDWTRYTCLKEQTPTPSFIPLSAHLHRYVPFSLSSPGHIVAVYSITDEVWLAADQKTTFVLSLGGDLNRKCCWPHD